MQQPEIKPIAFADQDIHAFFAPLSQQNWAILLESGSAEHVDSRFHIIVADPLATLITVAGQTVIDYHADSAASHRSTDDPFALVANISAALLADISTADDVAAGLPFLGGALGYFGYDLGRGIEVIGNTACADLDFADMAVGIYDWAIVVDRHSGQAWQVQCPLRHSSAQDCEQAWQQRHLWLQQAGVLASPASASNSAPATDSAPFKLTGAWQANMTELEYQHKFNQVQEYLKAGDCYQINLAQRFSNHYQGDEWQAYCTLSQHNKAPFSAFMRLPEQAVLSISPERFIQLQGDCIETKPIKGTRPRSSDPARDRANAEDLRNADKDRAENVMIVDLLRNDIGKIAVPGSVTVPHLFAIESFPAVHHLVSTIRGQLPRDKRSHELLRACFPGGSITGAPKIRAMQIIEELEPHRRSLYCGSIGYISQHGNMDTSITIRTLLCTAGAIHCWAGGGLVADSVVTAEYQETFDKLAKILPIL